MIQNMKSQTGSVFELKLKEIEQLEAEAENTIPKIPKKAAGSSSEH